MTKIALVLTARFPSEKAYAVTTRGTNDAANAMGIESRIYAPSEQVDFFTTKLSGRAIDKLTSYIGRFPSRFDAVLFTVRRLLLALNFKSASNSFAPGEQIVWTRDPIVALIMAGRQEVVLELHGQLSLLDRWICKFLDNQKKILVGTLTNHHKSVLERIFRNSKVILLPMGVPKDFFIDSARKPSHEIVGYVGKGWSSGHDNKLTHLVHAAKLLEGHRNPHIKWKFLGLEPEYRELMQLEIDQYQLVDNQICFEEHRTHDEVPDFLREISVGIIPYPDSTYNNYRFPIKALEYAAAGVSIVATDTPGNRRVLHEDFCSFYSPHSKDSLANTLLELFSEPTSRDQKIERARLWAMKHGYEERVKVILSALGHRGGSD